ncbi:TetR/AcrR family transcriptional regulator [Enterococcus ratti]|uniref:Transcriptional regulator, TetR family n=1 Tax=Enterococcus ratti TaxID=150033 RepID=A0A1L8WPJ8_9ENTE|nr:TetR/AcrR family transcriptional regulator [Enterococcus ratti]OJG82947.1 Transcriptional regulator, TetR family [Enterococcus ratti]
MSKKKNPEETRKKIIDVSKQLFLEKGYDNTSIQDIINGLGGLTKGVIYHHFNSKFDILQTIVNNENDQNESFDWSGKTGLEKLQNSLKAAFKNLEKQKLAYSAAITLRSPRLLGEQYLDMFEYAVPEIQKMVQEGISDGSITTEYPEEVADLIVLTLNIWIGFQSSTLSEQDLQRKIKFIKYTFDRLGIPLITDEIIHLIYDLFNHLKNE